MKDTIESWEAMLDQHLYYTLQSARTGDFSFVEQLQVSSFAQSTNHQSVLQAETSDGEAKKVLDDLNVKSAKANEEAITDFQDTINSDKDWQRTPEGWKTFLMNQQDKQINFVTEKIKAATNEAKEFIGTLPWRTRESAANVYIKGSDIVMDVFKVLSEKLEGVLTKIDDFLKGIFTAVTDAYSAVVNAVRDGINAIRGFSGASLRVADNNGQTPEHSNIA